MTIRCAIRHIPPVRNRLTQREICIRFDLDIDMLQIEK
ncbi:uncharacterized protein METZ01_LOCUS62419, partial [marine metagenome]